MEDLKILTVNGVSYALDLCDEKKDALVQQVLMAIPDGDEVAY